jgi:hypothetical protein
MSAGNDTLCSLTVAFATPFNNNEMFARVLSGSSSSTAAATIQPPASEPAAAASQRRITAATVGQWSQYPSGLLEVLAIATSGGHTIDLYDSRAAAPSRTLRLQPQQRCTDDIDCPHCWTALAFVGTGSEGCGLLCAVSSASFVLVDFACGTRIVTSAGAMSSVAARRSTPSHFGSVVACPFGMPLAAVATASPNANTETRCDVVDLPIRVLSIFSEAAPAAFTSGATSQSDSDSEPRQWCARWVRLAKMRHAAPAPTTVASSAASASRLVPAGTHVSQLRLWERDPAIAFALMTRPAPTPSVDASNGGVVGSSIDTALELHGIFQSSLSAGGAYVAHYALPNALGPRRAPWVAAARNTLTCSFVESVVGSVVVAGWDLKPAGVTPSVALGAVDLALQHLVKNRDGATNRFFTMPSHAPTWSLCVDLSSIRAPLTGTAPKTIGVTAAAPEANAAAPPEAASEPFDTGIAVPEVDATLSSSSSAAPNIVVCGDGDDAPPSRNATWTPLWIEPRSASEGGRPESSTHECQALLVDGLRLNIALAVIERPGIATIVAHCACPSALNVDNAIRLHSHTAKVSTLLLATSSADTVLSVAVNSTEPQTEDAADDTAGFNQPAPTNSERTITAYLATLRSDGASTSGRTLSFDEDVPENYVDALIGTTEDVMRSGVAPFKPAPSPTDVDRAVDRSRTISAKLRSFFGGGNTPAPAGTMIDDAVAVSLLPLEYYRAHVNNVLKTIEYVEECRPPSPPSQSSATTQLQSLQPAPSRTTPSSSSGSPQLAATGTTENDSFGRRTVPWVTEGDAQQQAPSAKGSKKGGPDDDFNAWLGRTVAPTLATQSDRDKLLSGVSARATEPEGRVQQYRRERAAKQEADRTKQELMEAQERLAERGERLNELGERTSEMSNRADNFASAAAAYRKQQESRKWWQF